MGRDNLSVAIAGRRWISEPVRCSARSVRPPSERSPVPGACSVSRIVATSGLWLGAPVRRGGIERSRACGSRLSGPRRRYAGSSRDQRTRDDPPGSAATNIAQARSAGASSGMLCRQLLAPGHDPDQQAGGGVRCRAALFGRGSPFRGTNSRFAAHSMSASDGGCIVFMPRQAAASALTSVISRSCACHRFPAASRARLTPPTSPANDPRFLWTRPDRSRVGDPLGTAIREGQKPHDTRPAAELRPRRPRF